MTRITLLTALFSVLCLTAVQAADIRRISLEGKEGVPAPKAEPGKDGIDRIHKVETPALELFPTAKKPARGTIIVCPGGGYSILAINHEGYYVAKKLNEFGYDVAILLYHVNAGKETRELAIADAKAALALVQKRGSEFGLSTKKIGVMGFSAGGHLAARLTHAAAEGTPLDFAVLMYPAYLEKNGKVFEDVAPVKTPAFVYVAGDDKLAPSSEAYAAACKEKNIPCDFTKAARGGHGFGLKTPLPADVKNWPDKLHAFLNGLSSSSAPGAVPGGVKFVKHQIGAFRSEAFGVADFNGDGQLDIVAGNFLYLAPDFKPLKIRSAKGAVDEHGKGYYNDFMNVPVDVEGNGRPGVASVDWFSRSVYYYRNTLGQPGDWPETVVDTSDNYECGDLVDLEGKGRQSIVLTHTRETVWYEVGVKEGKPGLVKHVVSTKKMEFGAGVGDVNGDGRPDIIRPDAWFEAPADIRTGTWKEHPLSLGDKNGKMAHTPQILVFDVNGDGLNDLITSNAHGYGIFWYEQVRDGEKVSWKQHTIDDTWTQAHSLALADLDGCGTPELITGKRFMAHNGSDPDENGRLGLYYYKLVRTPGKPVTWEKHVISYDDGVGAGLAIWAGKFRQGGGIDIIVTGKFGGPVWFENKGR